MKNLSRLMLLSLVLIPALHADFASDWERFKKKIGFSIEVREAKVADPKKEWQELQDQFLKAHRALVACGAKKCAIEKKKKL